MSPEVAVPAVDEALDRPAARVAELLRTTGLRDGRRLLELVDQIVAPLGAGVSAADAVRHAQARIDGFVEEVLGVPHDRADPLWLRAFVGTHPEVFLGDPAAARPLASTFGDHREGLPPVTNRFADQQLRLPRPPRWLAYGALPGLATAAVVAAVAHACAADGLTAVELVWVGLLGFLFLSTAVGTTCAVVGFVRGRRPRTPAAVAVGALPPTVVLVPICHEDVSSVYAGVHVMRAGLSRMPDAASFEFFVISDSRDPVVVAEEERLFARLGSEEGVPFYYRKRRQAGRAKVGNVAEFFERWGHRYTYAVMLDADSLLSAEAIVGLVRRIHAEPDVGLVQAPIHLHRGETLLARLNQFATSVVGPVVTRGLSEWSGDAGNFYGHNAVVRVSAFLECCALPELQGTSPFGGTILSHDFVEAALLRRAGWQVRIAHDLGPTWEEFPRTLPEYVRRDRRWCQGNLQHLRVVLSEGLHPMSRIHMLVGVSAYLAGPVWLAFAAAGVDLARTSPQGVLTPTGGVLLGIALLNVLGPRVLGLLDTALDGDRRRAHGGVGRLSAGMVCEVVASTAVAPLLMFHHARIVLSVLLGRSSGWSTPRRVGPAPGFGAGDVQATVVGVAAAAVLWWRWPDLLPWTAVVWVPLVLAVPTALAVSSGRLGNVLRRCHLLLVPGEIEKDPALATVDAVRRIESVGDADRFRDIVLDPVLLSVHLAYLANRAPSRYVPVPPREELDRLCELALHVGPEALRPDQRRSIEGDEEAMRRLHVEAWQHWPVETWRAGRAVTSAPPEDVPAPRVPAQVTRRPATGRHLHVG